MAKLPANVIWINTASGKAMKTHERLGFPAVSAARFWAREIVEPKL